LPFLPIWKCILFFRGVLFTGHPLPCPPQTEFLAYNAARSFAGALVPFLFLEGFFPMVSPPVSHSVSFLSATILSPPPRQKRSLFFPQRIDMDPTLFVVEKLSSPLFAMLSFRPFRSVPFFLRHTEANPYQKTNRWPFALVLSFASVYFIHSPHELSHPPPPPLDQQECAVSFYSNALQRFSPLLSRILPPKRAVFLF